MQNPVALLVRSVVEWFRSNHRISAKPKLPHPALTPEEFRHMLAETLVNDPELARRMLRPLIGAVIPIVAGTCGTLAKNVGGDSDADRTFGSADCNTNGSNYSFPNRLGVGVTPSGADLQVKAQTTSAVHILRRGSGSGNGEFWAFAVQHSGAGDNAAFGQTSSTFSTGGSPAWFGNSNAFLYFNDSQQLRIGAGTGSTPWLTIAGSTGNVGIANASPSEKLDVTGNAKVSGNLTVDTSTLVVNASTDRVGIGTASPNNKLSVEGDVDFGTTGTKKGLLVNGRNNDPTLYTAVASWLRIGSGGGVGIWPDANVLNNDNPAFFVSNTNTVGIGTTSPDSKLDVRGSINKIFYLRPQGSPNDDGQMINDAIKNLPDDGGIIYLLPGTYNIKQTITNFKSGNYSKRAVKLRGFGGMAIDYFFSGQQTPLTSLKWDSSVSGSGKRVVSFESVSSTLFSQDFEISDLTIDGSGVAEGGLYLRSISTSKFINVQIQNLPVTGSVGIEVTSAAGEGTQQGSGWNMFLNCSVEGAARGVLLTKETDSEGNASHNSFIGLSIAYFSQNSNNAGIWLDDCDNNLFQRVWIFPRQEGQSIVGYGVVIDNPIARSNYFYQLQGTVGSKSLKVIHADSNSIPDNKNMIFGYDLENGQDQPEAFTTGGSSTPPAPFLFWIDSHGFVHFSNSSSSSSGMDGAMEYLSSELTFTIGTTPHTLAS